MPKTINPIRKHKEQGNIEVDRNSVQYLKYKDIALDFIKAGYNNIQAIYSKYYPNASEDSLKAEPYRLLDNVRFQIALGEVYAGIKKEELDLAQIAVKTLYEIATKGKKDADRVAAASWLGKCEGLFLDRSDNTHRNINTEQEKALDSYYDALMKARQLS